MEEIPLSEIERLIHDEDDEHFVASHSVAGAGPKGHQVGYVLQCVVVCCSVLQCVAVTKMMSILLRVAPLPVQVQRAPDVIRVAVYCDKCRFPSLSLSLFLSLSLSISLALALSFSLSLLDMRAHTRYQGTLAQAVAAAIYTDNVRRSSRDYSRGGRSGCVCVCVRECV